MTGPLKKKRRRTFNIRASYNADEEEKKCPVCWMHMWKHRRGLV
jgi:hypothetical protein